MQSITSGVSSLICSIVTILAGPTILMLLVRRFVPNLGEELWRSYCQLLMWLLRMPFYLIRMLVNEIVTARHRR